MGGNDATPTNDQLVRGGKSHLRFAAHRQKGRHREYRSIPPSPVNDRDHPAADPAAARPATAGAALSPLRAELLAIAERFAEADRRAQQARVYQQSAERAVAEAEALEAAGDYYAASRALADLLLLLRHGKAHCREALRVYLVELLADDIADAAVTAAREVSHG